MDIIGFIKQIESRDEFTTWLNKHKNPKSCHLANIFFMRTSDGCILQAGYYNDETDRMTTFSFKDKNIDINEEKEIFKKPKTKIDAVNLNDVKIKYEDMQKKIKIFIDEHYPNEKPNKEIIILQKTDVDGKDLLIWNVTYITNSFKILNIKLDAIEGKIVFYELKSIMDFRTNVPNKN